VAETRSGAAQSIEDGGTLGVLMSRLEDISDIPARLKLYDELRVSATSIVQLLSHTSEVSDEVTKPHKDPGRNINRRDFSAIQTVRDRIYAR